MRRESVSSHPARAPGDHDPDTESRSAGGSRLWLSLFLFIVLAGLIVGTTFDWRSGDKADYPHERTIHSNDGRQIEVVMLGRRKESFYIERKADGKRFELLMDKVSEEDRAAIERLPEGGETPISLAGGEMANGLSPEQAKFLELRRAELAAVEADLAGIREMKDEVKEDVETERLLIKQKWLAYELRKEIAEAAEAWEVSK